MGVIEELVSIESSQAPLPWLLRNYVRNGAYGNWDQVKSILAINTPVVSDLADLMEQFDGDLAYKDLEKAAKAGGHDAKVPFTPGRTDASQEQTDVESFT